MRDLVWVGSSKKDVAAFPDDVREEVEVALVFAVHGEKSPAAKVLQGFGGAGVIEVVANDDGNTFRTVYTVRFASAIYVLHAFQKKSTRGSKTPKREMDLVRQRLRRAGEIEHERTRPIRGG